MSASSSAAGEVSTVARMSSEAVGWAGWPSATGDAEGEVEEA